MPTATAQEKIQWFREAFEETGRPDFDNLYPFILEYVQHRGDLKKKLTHRAIKLLVNKFEGYNTTEVKQAIERSIVSGWTSVFPQHEPVQPTEQEIPKDTVCSRYPELEKKLEYLIGVTYKSVTMVDSLFNDLKEATEPYGDKPPYTPKLLIMKYLQWLEDQPWIHSYTPEFLSFRGNMFKLFRQAINTDEQVDIITGRYL
jgi:hypothetical protein